MLNHYTTPPPGLDPVFQALSDGTRRGIVARLAQGPATVSELAAPLPCSLPAVLQHLKVLEAAGLVRSEKQGRVRTCRLDTAPLDRAEGWIADQRQLWSAALDRLETLLASDPGAETTDHPKGSPE